MGKAKVVMEPIKNEKKRNITFQRRKQGIIKKAVELTTLCDVDLSMIIFTDNKDQQPQIFPQDSHKFNALIDLYRKRCITEPEKIGFCNVSDFFTNRKIKIEEELAKAKKKNLEAAYPTWFDNFNDCSEEQLRDFALGLGRKICHVQTKIESLKKIPKIHDQNLDHEVGNSLIMMPSLNPVQIPMDYNDKNIWFDSVDQCNLMIKQPTNLVKELLVNEDNDEFYDFESDIIQPPPPPGCFFPPPEAAPPAVNSKPFVMSNFPSQMMEYSNNFGFDQCDLFIKQPSNPSSLMEMLMSKDGNNCSDYDQNFSIQPPPVVFSFPPPPPQIVQQPEAQPVMYVNPCFKSV